ncbi:MATE family efflux transporter [Parapedobacter deserti]|uniref:MATE family efflux transporter n=1 Tax=Parapedobacter deserti TaxID=1912957 RepID=A0ABV7JMS2_9SPHI
MLRSLDGHLVIARKAFPIILANASVPLLGLVDTAAIGQTGGAQELGAIALGALIFSFIYWGFGFLRMGTTGFTAQSYGARDYAEVRYVSLRACLMGVGIGAVLIVLQHAVALSAFHLLDTSDEVKKLIGQYFYIRIWGAPATLCSFALLGVLVGLGQTRKLLGLQLFLNGLNILLNVFFVIGLGWSVRGIAAGTVIAEWAALLLGIWMVRRSLSGLMPRGSTQSWSRLFDRSKFSQMMRTNGNIMLRTLALLFGFAWFANRGAGFGDEVLAANHVLMQFVSLSAFFLDGYAYVVEMMVGKAMGARDERAYRVQLKQANQLAAVTAVLLAAFIWGFGSPIISGLTKDESVRILAKEYLPYACVYILVSFYAFQLDGVFIGSTRSGEMRNASLFSLLFFLTLSFLLSSQANNAGLWIAFIGYVIVRGLSLAYYLPRVSALFGR